MNSRMSRVRSTAGAEYVRTGVLIRARSFIHSSCYLTNYILLVKESRRGSSYRAAESSFRSDQLSHRMNFRLRVPSSLACAKPAAAQHAGRAVQLRQQSPRFGGELRL